MTYLFEASVLDAQFLSIDKIKQLSILFSKGKNKEKESSGLRDQRVKTLHAVTFLCCLLRPNSATIHPKDCPRLELLCPKS